MLNEETTRTPGRVKPRTDCVSVAVHYGRRRYSRYSFKLAAQDTELHMGKCEEE